eukprot:7328-Heterococcus_DN1.PRE.4
MTLKPEKQHNAQRRALLYSPFVWSVAAAGRMRYCIPKRIELALPACQIMTFPFQNLLSELCITVKLARHAQHCAAIPSFNAQQEAGLAVHGAAAATAVVAADPVDLLKPVMELYMILEEVDQQLPNPNSWPIALRIVSSKRFQQKPLKLVFNGYSDKGDMHFAANHCTIALTGCASLPHYDSTTSERLEGKLARDSAAVHLWYMAGVACFTRLQIPSSSRAECIINIAATATATAATAAAALCSSDYCSCCLTTTATQVAHVYMTDNHTMQQCTELTVARTPLATSFSASQQEVSCSATNVSEAEAASSCIVDSSMCAEHFQLPHDYEYSRKEHTAKLKRTMCYNAA